VLAFVTVGYSGKRRTKYALRFAFQGSAGLDIKSVCEGLMFSSSGHSMCQRGSVVAFIVAWYVRRLGFGF
jgi:hypothetical protein